MKEIKFTFEELKQSLKGFVSYGCDECRKIPCPNYLLSGYVVYMIGKIFISENNKEAEKILRELLISRSDRFKFLVLCTFQEAISKDQDLSPETVIELEKTKNNPITQKIYREADRCLKAGKAEFN